MGSGCPWSTYVPDPFPFCEEQLCAWIGQPANTWSNIGYVVVGIILLARKGWPRERILFGIAAIALGLGSGIFHMSGTLWAKKLDVGAMLALSSLVLAESVARQVGLRFRAVAVLFFFFVLTSTPFIGMGRWGGILFLSHCFLSFLIEFVGTKKRAHSIGQKKKTLLLRSLSIFLIALLVNHLDQAGVLCDPDNHLFTGHGAWHLATAYCIWLVARYYLEPEPRLK